MNQYIAFVWIMNNLFKLRSVGKGLPLLTHDVSDVFLHLVTPISPDLPGKLLFSLDLLQTEPIAIDGDAELAQVNGFTVRRRRRHRLSQQGRNKKILT